MAELIQLKVMQIIKIGPLLPKSLQQIIVANFFPRHSVYLVSVNDIVRVVSCCTLGQFWFDFAYSHSSSSKLISTQYAEYSALSMYSPNLATGPGEILRKQTKKPFTNSAFSQCFDTVPLNY